MQKKVLSPPPLTVATGNLINLKSTSEMSPVKDGFLASYSKQTYDNFGRKLKKISIQTLHRRPYFTRFRKFVSNIF